METPQTLSAAVAAELRAELGRRFLSHSQLSMRLGRNKFWVSRRIGKSSTVSITVEDLAEIADAIDVKAEVIFGAALRAYGDSNHIC